VNAEQLAENHLYELHQLTAMVRAAASLRLPVPASIALSIPGTTQSDGGQQRGQEEYRCVSALGIVGNANSQLSIRRPVYWSLHPSPDSNALLHPGEIPVSTSALRAQFPALRDTELKLFKEVFAQTLTFTMGKAMLLFLNFIR